MTEERKRGNTDWLVIAMAVAALLATAWILSGPAPAAVSWLSQSVLNAIFVGLSWTASRRAGLSPVARRFWHGAIFGGALFTVGTLVQAALALNGSWDNAGSATVPTIVMSVGIASVIGFMFTNPPGATGRESLRLWLDATTVIVAVLVLVWVIAVHAYRVINPGALALTVVGGALALVSVFAIPLCAAPGQQGKTDDGRTAIDGMPDQPDTRLPQAFSLDRRQLLHCGCDRPPKNVGPRQVVMEDLDRRRLRIEERFKDRQQCGGPLCGREPMRWCAGLGAVIRVGATAARKGISRVQLMQSLGVLKQRHPTVERTALVDRTHRREEDSILSTMPPRQAWWQADDCFASPNVDDSHPVATLIEQPHIGILL